MKRWHALAVVAVFVLALPAAYRASSVLESAPNQQDVITGPTYLYIEEMEIGPGQVPNEAISEMQGWVKAMRETGEFTSVRLFIHNTGPRFALYVLAETDNWQSIETGFEKFFEAYPSIMEEPFRWGTHTDNLLSEIIVE
jgi:hypothetical protein